MLAIDVSATSSTTANTGVQRVCRALTQSLASIANSQPVCFDPDHDYWRFPNAHEQSCLVQNANIRPSTRRGSRKKKISGKLNTLLPSKSIKSKSHGYSGLIEPEIFSQTTFGGLTELFQFLNGPSLAVFYDATPLKLPELSPGKSASRFPAYLNELLRFDGIAAISDASMQEIINYWKWLGVKNTPKVVSIPLGVDMAHRPEEPNARGSIQTAPMVLCVGSIEGRKNQVSLLSAAEKLWSSGMEFHVKLVGLESPETSGPALDLLNQCKIKGRPVEWLGPQSEDDLRKYYENCSFTVYPSIAEGFGLPVLESLKHGKPCVCSSQGAIGEISNGGGCLTVEKPTPEALSKAMKTLLTDSELHSTLCNNARNRTFRTWSDYASDILEFHKSLNKSYEKSR